MGNESLYGTDRDPRVGPSVLRWASDLFNSKAPDTRGRANRLGFYEPGDAPAPAPQVDPRSLASVSKAQSPAVRPGMPPPSAPAPTAPDRGDESLISRASKMAQPVAAADDRSGLIAGALNNSRNSPSWGSDYSLAQVAHDEAARAGISNRYQAGLARNNAEEALRGDPMEDSIKARERTLRYESLMPASAVPRVSGRFGKGWGGGLDGTELGGDYDQSPPDFPLRGDVISIERANRLTQANMKPTDRIAIGNAQDRQGAMERIRFAVEAGKAKKLSPADLSEYLRPIIELEAQKGALGEGEYQALSRLLFPNAESAMAQQADKPVDRQ